MLELHIIGEVQLVVDTLTFLHMSLNLADIYKNPPQAQAEPTYNPISYKTVLNSSSKAQHFAYMNCYQIPCICTKVLILCLYKAQAEPLLFVIGTIRKIASRLTNLPF